MNPDFDESRFFERLRGAPSGALLLDYDGTLAPFVADRQRAVPYPGILDRITSISRGGRTRVAIVSGRPLEDLVHLLGPDLELWGSHGIEHRTRDGEIEGVAAPPELKELLANVTEWILRRGWEPIFERKPLGFALHVRADHGMFQTAAPAVVARWSAPLQDAGLEIRSFDAGVEVRPVGRHKGEIVEGVLGEAGPEAPVAYLGDDDTDEDAFRALRGRGLGVLVRRNERPTAADAWLRPPEELLEFLKRWEETQSPKPAA